MVFFQSVLVRACIAAAIVLGASSCDDPRQDESGPAGTETVQIEQGSADHANVEFDIGAGHLRLTAGSDKLVDGTLAYSVSALKPVVETSVNGSHAVVTIHQPSRHSWGRTGRNDWDLNLGSKALLDVAVNCGAGQAEMALGKARLRRLDVHMGAGQVDLDLRGEPQHDYDVKIAGGVGQATIHLPQGVGIRADAHGGIGSINVEGLTMHGDHYENDSYQSAKVTVRLTVEGGVGEIRIIA